MPQRERAGIPILGIDTSTPDDLVEDGKCQELHNLRYKESAWRPMHRFKLLHRISSMDVVYHHPISGRYIVREKIKGQVRYLAYDLSTPNAVPITLLGALDRVPEGTLINISHFGNVLTLSAHYFSASFIWSDGTYVRTEIDRYTPSVEFSFTHTDEVAYEPLALQVDKQFGFFHGDKSILLNPGKWYTYTDDLMTYIRNANFPSNTKIRFMWVLKDERYNNGELSVPSTQRDLYWSGEHAFFSALRMHDGSVCNLSPVLLNISQNNFGNFSYSVIDKITGVDDPLLGYTTHLLEKPLVLTTEFVPISGLPDDILSVYSPMRYGVGEYTVSIEEDVDATLIDSVVLFSTRVYPTLSLHKIEHKSGGDMTDAYNDVALPNEPFYILEERRLSEMERVKGKLSFSVEFDAEKAEDIISKTLYTPNIPHQLSGATSLDYNNRLHLANVTTTFTPSPLLNTSIMPTPQDVTTSLGVLIQHGFNKYPLWGSEQTGVELYPGNNLMLSYHDYRVDRFLSHVTDVSGSHTYSFAAKAATGNNMAYMVMPPTKLYKYPPIGLLNGEEAQYTPTEGSISITESNRIQVSQANNPFSFPFNLSYAVGSANNTILALQSAALEFPDEKRGDLPLIVFTEEGIFALRAGDNTLYARVDPINHDKIINPNTLAVNNMVAYITEEGIKLLSGSTVTIISSPILDVAGNLDTDFFKYCKMAWIKAHNEIMFFMDGNYIALIYNLENGFWCTRDIEGSKINTDELVSRSGIYSMEEDDTQPLGCYLVTRPIKLGSLGFKRLETIIPRVSPASKGWIIDVHGALSPALYWQLLRTIEANKNRPVIIRRTPFSAKYFRIALEMSGDNRFYISNIDVEYYHRFRHRLR